MTSRNLSGSTTRICFLVGTLVSDGAERQLVYMLRALQDAPVACRVMCLTQGEALEEELRAVGTPVEFVGAHESRFARLAAIIASLRREPADILQSTHFYTNIYAALAGRATGAAAIGAIRNDLVSELRANGVMGWGHLMLPQFLVANSRAGREQAIDRGRSASRVLLVENAVDMDRFSPSRYPDHPRPEGSIRLLSVGRLVRQKRMDRFLRVVKELNEGPLTGTVRARIVGDGPLEGELKELARALGLSPEQVTFTGRLTDTASAYRWADILVLASDHEGTPNVVIEAMASGLPVVAAAVGGIPDVLANGGGVLVDPRDEKALAQAVVDLAREPRARREMGLAGHRQVAAVRSIPALRHRLHDVHRIALEARSR